MWVISFTVLYYMEYQIDLEEKHSELLQLSFLSSQAIYE